MSFFRLLGSVLDIGPSDRAVLNIISLSCFGGKIALRIVILEQDEGQGGFSYLSEAMSELDAVESERAQRTAKATANTSSPSQRENNPQNKKSQSFKRRSKI